MEVVGVVVVLPRVAVCIMLLLLPVCIVLLHVLIHKAGVVCIQVV